MMGKYLFFFRYTWLRFGWVNLIFWVVFIGPAIYVAVNDYKHFQSLSGLVFVVYMLLFIPCAAWGLVSSITGNKKSDEEKKAGGSQE